MTFSGAGVDDGGMPAGTQPREEHSLLFYDEEETLTEGVSQFLAAGLAQGDRLIVIATPEHSLAFRDRLSASSFEVDDAIRTGQLALLDARETLSSLMVNGLPSPERFDAIVRPLVERASPKASGAKVRAFGEMVDLLCRDGNPEAAIQLEELWCELANRSPFWLLCAYANASFDRLDHAYHDRVERLHSHTHGVSKSKPGDSEVRALAVADFQRRARDVQIEHERQREVASHRLLVESVTDYAIFMLDTRGIVATWNIGAERIKGYRAAEIIGRHFSTFYPANDIAAGKCELELETAAAEGRFEDEGWRLRKDGTRFWANVIITALRDERGTLVGFGKVTRDLTERRRAEDARLDLAREQEANRVKDEFVATVSHELRTPLHAILGWATLAEASTSEPKAKATLTRIVRNAQVQARLIDDLLDLSRIATGKLQLEVNPANLVAIVKESIDIVRSSAEAKNLRLTFESAEMSAPLVADSSRLQQVVSNLLANAVKFTDEGGAVSVRLERAASSWRLSVQDTGRGIEPEFLPRVFERFSQAESARAARTGGLGLGLAIVRHLVELHGGSVAVESAGVGKGSTFTVVLPAQKP